MVNVFWFVPYVAAGGQMWFIAYQMAPIGREIPLSHAVSAVILMGCCGVAARNYLKPLVGNWEILFEFVAQTLVVMAILKLSFRRSLIAVFMYWVVMILGIVAIGLLARQGRK